MPILQNPNTMTLLDAKKDVARVLGNADNADNQSLAGDCIRDTIQDMNAARDWSWMFNQTTGNTVASQATVSIPSRTKKIIDVIVNNWVLTYVDQHDWDRQVVIGNTAPLLGGTFIYTIFDIAASNAITLRDTPGGVVPYTIKYVKLVDYPAADNTAIDVPETVMAYILSKAKSDYIARVNGDSEKLQYFTAQAKERYAKLLSEDTRQPDAEPCVLPGYLFPSPLNPNYDYWYQWW